MKQKAFTIPIVKNGNSIVKGKYLELTSPISVISGLGPARVKILNEKGIFTLNDIKRVSFRNFYQPNTRYIFSGGRLCF